MKRWGIMRVRKRKKPFLRFFLFLSFVFIGTTAYLFVKSYQEYQQVMVLEEKVDQQIAETDLLAYKDVILSMIYTESKGLGNDPMQSSESAYGEIGKMTLADDSIRQGVTYFSQALALAKEQQVDLWSAVQAYNFGLDYIYFVAENGGVNHTDLAQEYSRDVLAPQLGNVDRSRYRYFKLPALLYNGGYLYYNGGNLFYAETVRWNQQKIQFFHKLTELFS